ncbi:MAG: hypothetical protein AAF578_14865 [Pseudomonadota bacterium]
MAQFREMVYSAAKRIFNKHLLVADVISKQIEDPKDKKINTDLVVREASRAELAEACKNRGLDLSSSFLTAAEQRDDLCIAAFDEGALVAYSWVAFSGAPHASDVAVVVPPPFVYIYKSFCAPTHRGRSIMRDVGWERDRHALRRGRTHAIGFIEWGNQSSMRAYTKAGGRSLGVVGFVRCFGRVNTFRSRTVKPTGFCFTARIEK